MDEWMMMGEGPRPESEVLFCFVFLVFADEKLDTRNRCDDRNNNNNNNNNKLNNNNAFFSSLTYSLTHSLRCRMSAAKVQAG